MSATILERGEKDVKTITDDCLTNLRVKAPRFAKPEGPDFVARDYSIEAEKTNFGIYPLIDEEA